MKEGDHTVFQDGSFSGSVEGVTPGERENGSIVFDVGSGSYSFSMSESSPALTGKKETLTSQGGRYHPNPGS